MSPKGVVFLLLLVTLAAAYVLWLRAGRRELTAEDAARIIEDFIQGHGDPNAWEDFVSLKHRDPRVEAARRTCASIASTCPPRRAGEYCSEEGRSRLSGIASELRRAEPGS